MPKTPERPVLAAPWQDLVPNIQFRDVTHRLHREILAFSEYAQSTSKEQAVAQHVLKCIATIVARHFHGSKLELFGSSVTGLTLPVPDLDLVIVPPSTFDSAKKQLFQLRSFLQRNALADDVSVRHGARVPIARFATTPQYGSLDVDINFGNTNGLVVARLIKEYSTTMPALRPLALVIKNLIANEKLNDPASAGIGSYAVVCMCINFLQLNPSKLEPELINDPIKSESLGTLLTDLLHYYGVTFPYTTSYVSVKNSTILPRCDVPWIHRHSQLAVQCIIDPELNIAASLSSLPRLQECFRRAYTGLLTASDKSAPVLSQITGFRSEVLAHRATIESLPEPPPLLRDRKKGSSFRGRSKPNGPWRGGKRSTNQPDRAGRGVFSVDNDGNTTGTKQDDRNGGPDRRPLQQPRDADFSRRGRPPTKGRGGGPRRREFGFLDDERGRDQDDRHYRPYHR